MAKSSAKKGKRPDSRPARIRYWNSKSLLKRKIGNMIRCNGVPPETAKQVWLNVRQHRRIAGAIRNMPIAPFADDALEFKWCGSAAP